MRHIRTLLRWDGFAGQASLSECMRECMQIAVTVYKGDATQKQPVRGYVATFHWDKEPVALVSAVPWGGLCSRPFLLWGSGFSGVVTPGLRGHVAVLPRKVPALHDQTHTIT